MYSFKIIMFLSNHHQSKKYTIATILETKFYIHHLTLVTTCIIFVIYIHIYK